METKELITQFFNIQNSNLFYLILILLLIAFTIPKSIILKCCLV